MNFELILNEKHEMELLEWAKPTWPRPSRPEAEAGELAVLDGDINSGERRHNEVGP
jgi:hypothetical protein